MRLMKQLPKWCQPGRELPQPEGSRQRKHFERSIVYFTKLFQATPAWMHTPENRAAYYAVRSEMRRQRRLGRDVVMDHKVPIVSDYVCGLNVPWNLEIITAFENGRKGNRWWPGCGFEPPEDMFGREPEPHQQDLWHAHIVQTPKAEARPRAAQAAKLRSREHGQEKLLPLPLQMPGAESAEGEPPGRPEGM